MQLKMLFSLVIICFFSLTLFVNVTNAISQHEYEIEINVKCSCPIPFQSISPVICEVELTNMGTEPFNGTLTIECKTKEGHWTPAEIPVSNLNETTQQFKRNFSTDHAGRYWVTVKLKGENLDEIYLYEEEELVDQGLLVQTQDSVFLHSFSEFIAIMAIAVGAIVAVAVAIYRKTK